MMRDTVSCHSHRGELSSYQLAVLFLCLVAGAGSTRAQQALHAFNDAAAVTPPVPRVDDRSFGGWRDATLLPAASAPKKIISWKALPGNILRDEKGVWLFPLQVGRGQHLFPTISIVGVTAGLVVADKYDTPYFVHSSAFHGFSQGFSGTNTAAAIAIVPATFYIAGLIRHDPYAEQTALLAGEAYVASAIPMIAIKIASRRLRPINVPPNRFSDTFFRSNVSLFNNGSGFPSGHATGAFSVATVFAERYRKHRWVPWLAYGVAGLISFSRVPAKSHFPSDVFLGAALGYAITRYDVMRGVN